MAIDRYISFAEEVPPYVPPGHSGTLNRRLIGREKAGAKNFELVLGRLEEGGGAHPHAHPDLEQGIYVLEGRLRIEMGGESREVGPGGAIFIPPGMPHEIIAVSPEPARLLVIYAPPLSRPPLNPS